MEHEINLTEDVERSWETFLGRYLLIVAFLSESLNSQDHFIERAVAEAEKCRTGRLEEDVDYLDTAKLASLQPYLVDQFPGLVLRSTLTLVVSEFETFLVDAIRKVLTHRKEFKRKRVPKNFHERFTYLTGEPLNIDPGFPSNKPFVRDELYEIHATRNILVHNRGIVDEKYLQLLPSPLFDIGKERPVTEEYVEVSCNTIFNTVLHLCIAISEKYSTESP